MFLWQVTRNIGAYQVVKQLRELEPGEPMHSGVRETKGWYPKHEDAQEVADKLNELEKAAEALGYSNAKVEYTTVAHQRVSVSINDDEIGIYDFDRHTFVD